MRTHHIRELDGLRGIMAAWVIIGHTLGALPALFGAIPNSLYNDIPVQVFIILSGFVIFGMLDRGYESYGRYLTGRAFRIFPVYLIVLVLSTFTLNFAEQVLRAAPVGVATAARIQVIDIARDDLVKHFLAHLLLLQGIFPHLIFPYAAVTIVGQAWSLTLEWQFYLVAPLLFFLVSRLTQRWTALVAALMVAVCWVVAPEMDSAFLSNGLPLFSIGFLSSFAFKRGLIQTNRRSRFAIFAASALLSGLLARDFAAASIIWLVSLFAATASSNELGFAAIRSALSSRLASYLGSVSYPLYLIHMQLLFACLWITNHFVLSVTSRIIILPLLTLGTSILASELLHRLIEVPFQRIGRRLSTATHEQARQIGPNVHR
ncbi:acyltransferase family protein [Paraburkholderia sacchari]|uniref:acyltransferase family protein n=1 Tax=Paraburkholderia sacchari TaxID=159450 RepID=UPI0005421FD4|nr:acyltransferase [Paraburkholderia sacchari]NLP61665.1 acyltransferase [Paraburkholderia sacchari]